MDGLTIMARLKEKDPNLRTLLLTGHGDQKLEQATRELSAGYFEKDSMEAFWKYLSNFGRRSGVIIIPPDEAATSWPNTLEYLAAGEALERRTHDFVPEDLTSRETLLGKIVGEAPPMQNLKNDIVKVAAMDCTVLLLGETGTGKELVARTIHALSPRSSRRFLAANCSSFSPDLLTNELFGHDKEAFTGAHHVKQGFFEAADGGTILLDEVGDTPLAMQAQLLRVLQEKTVIRVGSTSEIAVNVRVLAATNRDLEKSISEGRFREDLYYRLNIFTIRIPPLRERRDDIELLAGFFLHKYRRKLRKEIEGFSEEVLDILNNYGFPGNVRELENIVERSSILCDSGPVERRHLPERLRTSVVSTEVHGSELLSLADLERQHIMRVLSAVGNNKNEASKILGINRASLWRKLKKYENED
ncbi:MAG: sigma-54 dependent transcriptional regulator [Proteobacteria bacterium]|nr:sigma-54 dependent transcriptional regulator [Pseudomonadota bacterium]MBU1610415.1 sigma-54 dependent transcriptional regulator [Pseudomonadota bacterium]